MKAYDIISIDAWRDSDGWTWNDWRKIGVFDIDIDSSPRKILKFFREKGYLSEYSKGKCLIDDDGYNLVVTNRNTLQPIYAIVYGDNHD